MKVNQLRSGVILSYINLALGTIIPFFYTPIMLGILGQEEYGLYSLSSTTVSYLSLLSFGFGSTIIRYIAKYRAQGEQTAIQRAFGFFLMLYGVMAVLVMVGGIFISWNIDSLFHQGLTETELIKMRALVQIMTISSALSFPASVFSATIAAYERFFYEKILNIISSIVGPVVNLFALYYGYTSLGMAIAGTILQLVFLLVKAYYCICKLKLMPRFKGLPWAVICEMIGFSFFTFLAAMVDMLFWATDKVILGMLTSTAAVAVYNIGGTFNSMVINLSSSISGILVPRITRMVTVSTPKEEWSALFIRVGRLQFLIIALIISGFSVFGRSFLLLWVGPEYIDAFWVAVLTLFPLCIPLIQNTGVSIVTAQNKHQFRSVVYLIIAVINVISTYLIVPYMGLIGAALCSCVSYLLGQGLIMNIYYYKITGLDIPSFWGNILKMAIVPGVMLVMGMMLNRVIMIDNWFVFFGGVILFTVVYAVLMYCFAMNDYEKDIVRKPMRKIACVLRKE